MYSKCEWQASVWSPQGHAISWTTTTSHLTPHPPSPLTYSMGKPSSIENQSLYQKKKNFFNPKVWALPILPVNISGQASTKSPDGFSLLHWKPLRTVKNLYQHLAARPHSHPQDQCHPPVHPQQQLNPDTARGGMQPLCRYPLSASIWGQAGLHFWAARVSYIRPLLQDWRGSWFTYYATNKDNQAKWGDREVVPITRQDNTQKKN